MAHFLAPAAKADLSDIWDYVARESASAEAANCLIDRIMERFLLLANQRYLGRSRNEFGRNRRSFAVGEYVIVYRVEGKDVRILRVVHGRRDLEAIFGR